MAADAPTATLEPNDLLLFARVADEGSFSRAAERLGMPKSTVSRRVAALESALGERLILRTTRALTLTDFGRAVLDHAHHLVEDVEATAALAQHRQSQPSGRLRVTVPGDMANLVLAPLLARFVLDYPSVKLELDLTARFVDLVAENVDVAIRMGPLEDDATLAARQVASLSGSVCASPTYLARRGVPSEPEALMEHEALLALGRDGAPLPWKLARGDAHWQGVPPGRAAANSPGLLMQMALDGAGITVVKDAFALPHLESGALVPVLADWSLPPTPVWAVFPGRRLMPSRTRAFLDVLAERFSSPECSVVEHEIAQAKAKAGDPRPQRPAKARVPG